MTPISSFARSESGAITVDWTVMAAASVSLALALSAALTDVFGLLSGQVDGHLRDRQLGDEWVEYYASHFQASLNTGYISEDQAEVLYQMAEGMSSYAVRQHLADGIAALENGTITTDELMALIAVGSVAYQQNLADPAMLDYYFGFEGSDPYYMTTAAAPTSAEEPYDGPSCMNGHENSGGQACNG